MTKEEKSKILIKSLQTISLAALIYSLVILSMLLVNYINLKSLSPLESGRRAALLEKIDANPQDQNLREAYRSLDLVSRKAFFISTRQIDRAKILLIVGLVVFFFAWQFSLVLQKPPFPLIKEKTGQEQLSLRLKHISALAAALLLLVPLFVLSALNSNLISGKSKSRGPAPTLAEDSRGNWNSFRNMGRPYKSETKYPLSWDAEKGENIQWQQKLELPGFSSPVIWNESIFLTGGNKDLFRIQARFLSDGSLLWKYDIPIQDPEGLPSVQADTGYAASSPAVSENGIFAIFAAGKIFALDLQGQKLWTKQLPVPDNHYGHSSSLLAYAGLLYVQFDTNEEKFVAAYDQKSGEEVWKAERAGEISWTSPILAEWKGKVYLLLNSSPAISAYGPLSGELLWETECLSGEVAPSLAFAEGIISAAQAYSALVSLDIETGKILKEEGGALPDVSSPISMGEFLFVPSTYGTLTTVKPADLSEYWFYEQTEGFYSSPVIANDKLYLCDLAGKCLVFAISGKMEIIGGGSFPEPIYATPAFTKKGIVLRTKSGLYLISGDAP